jgi:hypothetical protein
MDTLAESLSKTVDLVGKNLTWVMNLNLNVNKPAIGQVQNLKIEIIDV